MFVRWAGRVFVSWAHRWHLGCLVLVIVDHVVVVWGGRAELRRGRAGACRQEDQLALTQKAGLWQRAPSID